MAEEFKFFECSTGQKFGFPNQIFGSGNQKFVCLNPNHLFVGLIKNEGPHDQNFGWGYQIFVRLFQIPQKFGSTYKISISVELKHKLNYVRNFPISPNTVKNNFVVEKQS